MKGQPGTKPTQVPNPVPNVDAEAEAAEYLKGLSMPEFNPAQAEVEASEHLQNSGIMPQEQPQFKSPWYMQAIPPVMGVAGGIAGAALSGPFAPAGAVAGAAVGGAAGQGYREWIEQNLLGKQPEDPNKQLMDVAKAAGEEGAGQAIGMGIGKALGTGAKYIPEKVKSYMSDAVKSVRDEVMAPLTKILATRSTPMHTEAAGDTAKNLLVKNVETKYNPFIKAYQGLEEIANVTPIRDEARRGFTTSLREGWAAKSLSGDNYRMVNKFAHEVDAANNMMQLDDAIKSIGDAKRLAFKNGATNQGKVLQELEERVTNFSENEITKLAARIKGGKASPEEMMFLDRMVLQRGITEANPMKYAKSLADDYLKHKDLVKNDYRGFRAFLEDVGEQTGIKGAERLGPKALLKRIQDVPSEKLIERMFDPKNAAALRQMQKETPEVFDIVAKSKISQLVQKAGSDGNLNIGKFHKLVNDLPGSTRSILFSADELKTMNLVVNNPGLKRLENLERRSDNVLLKLGSDIANAAGVAGDVLKKMPKTQAALNQGIGRPLVEVGKMLAPPKDQK